MSRKLTVPLTALTLAAATLTGPAAQAATYRYEGTASYLGGYTEAIFQFTGIDANGDGVLKDTELQVTNTSYSDHCPWGCYGEHLSAITLDRITLSGLNSAIAEGWIWLVNQPRWDEPPSYSPAERWSNAAWIVATPIDVAPVPLAAGAVYLLGGLGALSGLRRRGRRAGCKPHRRRGGTGAVIARVVLAGR